MVKESIITGKISQSKFEERTWGHYARLFTDWGDGWTGHYAVVNTGIGLESIVKNPRARCVGVVAAHRIRQAA